MATIIASGETFETQTIEAVDGMRLVNAIEGAGIDILHRCGGWAKCTTCRVDITSGNPEAYTQGETEKLTANGDMGTYRLACQVVCAGDMEVTVLMTKTSSGLDDAGPDVSAEIQND